VISRTIRVKIERDQRPGGLSFRSFWSLKKFIDRFRCSPRFIQDKNKDGKKETCSQLLYLKIKRRPGEVLVVRISSLNKPNGPNARFPIRNFYVLKISKSLRRLALHAWEQGLGKNYQTLRTFPHGMQMRGAISSGDFASVVQRVPRFAATSCSSCSR
jgi:hypothetical protein